MSRSWVFANFYSVTLAPLLIITLLLAWLTRPKTSEPLPAGFQAHCWRYLTVWYIAVAADWLQGPYVYALYESYGFSQREIAQLYVAGFGASLAFGTFAGMLADWWGRKRCAILYCVLYAISCMTKHVGLYSVLMIGRVTGGIATSLLFSAFECWMVAEHCRRRKFSDALLRFMFGLMFFGMYASAVLAGFAAQAAADWMPLQPMHGYKHVFVGGYTAPFDLSMVLLLANIVPICLLWEENYGDVSGQGSLGQSVVEVYRVLVRKPKVGMLGVVVAAFESAMYAFVLYWTPALHSSSVPTPHGLVFSLFMMACICGSSAFSLTDPGIQPSTVLFPTLCLAAVALGFIAISVKIGNGGFMLAPTFYACLTFELCVGLYFPAVGTLKSTVVPEACRAGVYNAYRVPLNAIVCVLLLTNFSLGLRFAICCALLVVAVLGLFAFIGQRPCEERRLVEEGSLGSPAANLKDLGAAAKIP